MVEYLDHVLDERPHLERFDHFPVALLDVPASGIRSHLAGPSLFHLPGRAGAPLFVSVLLHGNEDTGWQAVQTVLQHHRRKMLPRPLLLFVGNVEAAQANVRTLPTQTDYNRTWPGTLLTSSPEAELMREVTEIVKGHRPFASIDIHNNTGHNPHYACVNRLEERFFHLARLFSRTLVYFKRPLGVQSAALAPICPAVTVECGRVGDTTSVKHAAEFIELALAMSHFPEHSVPEGDLDLMQTFAIVKIPNGSPFSFDGAEADFQFRADLDHLNFSELEPGTLFGVLGGGATRHLEVIPGDDSDMAGPYFDYAGRDIRLSQHAIPAMLTLDPNAIRLDCLGYLMHRIGREGGRSLD